MRLAVPVVVAASVWLLALLSAGCTPGVQSAEDAVRQSLDELIPLIENRDLRGAGDRLTPDYRDTRHVDRRAALGTLSLLLRRHRSVHLFTHVVRIDVDPAGERADALVYAALTGIAVESPQALLSLNVDLYRFDLQLRRVDERWQIQAAAWRRAEPAELLAPGDAAW